MQIIDRRKVALGGQNHTRTRSKITAIAWHYTAVARKNKAFITTHEKYWRNHHGWKRGGYHFYIDADGKIYQNYDYETVSNGVGGNNSYIVNICVEANSAEDYSQAQIEARDWLTRKVMKDLNIPASRVMGHKEFPGQSTACPGYSKAQMDAFRRDLGSGELVSTKPVAKPAAKPVAKNPESIVDYLNSIKVNSSPTNRKKIAAAHGIKNYTGTAAQNTQLLESVKKNGVTPRKATPAKATKSIAQMAQEVIDQKHGNGHENRRKSLGISATEYEKVRAEVNRRAGIESAPVKPKKTIEQMAKEIINNPKVPKGHTARQKWLGIDNATYQKVRARVNQIL